MPKPPPRRQPSVTTSREAASQAITCNTVESPIVTSDTRSAVERVRDWVLDARAQAILMVVVIVFGGAWHLSHVLRESVFTIPMSEPIKMAQVYYFANGYSQNQSAIIH